VVLTIDSVEAIPVRAERTKPMISAGGGAPLRVSDFGIVRIRTSDGIEGVGEISMNGGRTGAIQCDDVNRIIGPALVGQDPTRLRAIAALMERVIDGSEPAKAGVEMALVDITGKARGLPAHAVIGGAVRERVPIRWGLAFGPPDDGVREASDWVGRGVRTIKIKIGRPGTDLDEQMVRAVREGLGTGVNVMVDANSGYRTPQEAVQELRRLEPFGLQLVEQPVSRRHLPGMAWVRRAIGTPVLADESMRHWSEAYDVARAEAADVLAVYVCEAGGMLAAQKAAAIGEAAGLPVTIGSQCELGIGTAAMAHVAVTLPNLAYESDITGHLRYPVDIIAERLDYDGGAVRPPDGPGLGVTIDEDVLRRWRLDA
jgi:L-alanine-DL-glutamate epimerase-like enolase superfamily enzyme